MKIRFLSRQQPRTGRPDGDPIYEEGEIYDLRPDRARWWISQNVAVRADQQLRRQASAFDQAAADERAERGTDLDDPGTDASRPDAMTTADIKLDPTSEGSGNGGADDALDDMTRSKLIELANERSIDLPEGYLKKDDLIATIRESRGR